MISPISNDMFMALKFVFDLINRKTIYCFNIMYFITSKRMPGCVLNNLSTRTFVYLISEFEVKLFVMAFSASNFGTRIAIFF